VSHDRYLLDRVSTMVIGLDRGGVGMFADYSQWEASRREAVPEKPPARETRGTPVTPPEGPQRKLSYLNQREWDGMEAKILAAEESLAARRREFDEAASDAARVTEAYERMQAAQHSVEELYARWAELESMLVK